MPSESRQRRPVFSLEAALGRTWAHLHECERATERTRDDLSQSLIDQSAADSAIVFHGSIARREVTASSDADWSLLIDGRADPQHMEASLVIAARLEELALGRPGAEKVFGQLTFSHDLINYIGGEGDTNANTTRRILLLLESTPIGQPEAHLRVIRSVLTRYLSEDDGWQRGGKVPRFLLNDISRYWRTIAVDYAYKQRQRGRKGWAVRNAKLRLSRKLTYTAGLLYAFSCATDPAISSLPAKSSTRGQAVTEHLSERSGITPLDALAEAVLPHAALHEYAGTMLDCYDEFLGILDDPESRQQLETLSPAAADGDPLFQRIRRYGQQFQAGLDRIFLERNSTGLFELIKQYGVF